MKSTFTFVIFHVEHPVLNLPQSCRKATRYSQGNDDETKNRFTTKKDTKGGVKMYEQENKGHPTTASVIATLSVAKNCGLMGK